MVIIGIERKCLWTRNHNKGEVSGDWSVRSRSLIFPLPLVLNEWEDGQWGEQGPRPLFPNKTVLPKINGFSIEFLPLP